MSREELIDYLYENNVHADISIEDLADEITAEPKVGRWIKLDETETLNESYTCSQCGYRRWISKVRFLYEPKLVLNYCPNCGAKMEG